jgi:hypothetical protein
MSDIGKILESMLDSNDELKDAGFNKIYIVGDFECNHIIVIAGDNDDAINLALPHCSSKKVQFIRSVGIAFNSCKKGVLAT